MLQRDHIGMIHGSHQLQLTIFVPLVLQDFLNGNSLTSLQAFGLETRDQDIIIRAKPLDDAR